MIEIAPGVTRKKPLKTHNRKISIKTEIDIVREHYLEGTPQKELAEQYDIKQSTISSMFHRWEFGKATKEPEIQCEPEENKENVLIIEGDLEFVAFLLAEHNINFRFPEKFEFTETFESSINGETN